MRDHRKVAGGRGRKSFPYRTEGKLGHRSDRSGQCAGKEHGLVRMPTWLGCLGGWGNRSVTGMERLGREGSARG